jgi:hypothetical protein
MRNLSCFVALSFFSSITFAQTTDTLNVYYKTDQSVLSPADRQSIDKFLLSNWDKIAIRSYADVTDEEEYNLDLSKKRATEVYNYLLVKKIPSAKISMDYYGESIELADNSTEEGRALNRRTTIAGSRYARMSVRPVDDPTKPITTTLDNGIIVTFRPRFLPADLEEAFRAGWGSNIQLVTNTTEMRNNNLYNNTTNGEILSSVMIMCTERFNPCKLDSPIFMKIPIPYTSCSIEKVKYFVAVPEGNRRIWKEVSKELKMEVINGQRYMGIWMDDFCGCINFDFKIEPGCFDVDSTYLITKNTSVRNFTTELIGLNSVYLPRATEEGKYKLLTLKNDPLKTKLSFSLYNGRRLIKRFYNQPLLSFPYNFETKTFEVSTDTVRFKVSGVKDFFMVLKVNRDRYRTLPIDNQFHFIYLNRELEVITVDIFATGKRKKQLEFKNVPLETIPYDSATGLHRIDKNFIQWLEISTASEKKSMASTNSFH